MVPVVLMFVVFFSFPFIILFQYFVFLSVPSLLPSVLLSFSLSLSLSLSHTLYHTLSHSITLLHISSKVRAGYAQAWFDGTVHTAANAAILGVLGYGGTMVLSGSISAGDLASFLLYSMLVAGNISALSSTYADVMRAVGASGRVFAIIDRKPDMPSIMERTNVMNGSAEEEKSNVEKRESKTQADEVQPLSIDFSNVTFSYPLRPEMNILGPHFNLQVEEGEVLALVGGSGSGKSTVAALLTRLYDVDNVGGAVSVGGMNIAELNPQELRESVGIVSQEPVLFATTIMENIRYGRLGATDEEVMVAAEAARVMEFATNFPEGLNTEVGSRGTQLSGGQKQRVAVARVILKDPPIVILDEATSALDAESEHHVQSAIAKIMDGRTVSFFHSKFTFFYFFLFIFFGMLFFFFLSHSLTVFLSSSSFLFPSLFLFLPLPLPLSPPCSFAQVISIAHRLSTIRTADRIAVLKDGVVIEEGTFDNLSSKKEGGAFRDLMQRQLTGS